MQMLWVKCLHPLHPIFTFKLASNAFKVLKLHNLLTIWV